VEKSMILKSDVLSLVKERDFDVLIVLVPETSTTTCHRLPGYWRLSNKDKQGAGRPF
jgi:hypothetical protein